jgi:phage virion morphogenesis protein
VAGAVIDVKIDDKQALALLERLRARGHNLTPAMKRIGEDVTKSVKENFNAGGRPEKWEPLAASTLFQIGGGRKGYTKSGRMTAKAANRVFNHMPLIRSGLLFSSIHPVAGPNSVEIGTDRVYGAIHQFGGQAGRGKKVKIPARPYLMVQDEDWPRIANTIADYIVEKGL